MSTATLEAPPAPAAVQPAPAQAAPVTPAQSAAPIAAPILNAETFLADAANVLPDALTGLMPAPPPITRSKPTPAPPAPVAATPATPVTPEPAPAVPTAPTPEPVTATPENKDFTKNWRLQAKDAKEAMVAQLMKTGASLTEAYQEVYGAQQPVPPAATPEPAQTPVAPQPDPIQLADQRITTLVTEVSTIEGEMDKAVEANDLSTLNKLSKQFTAKQLELSQAKTNRVAIEQSQADAEVHQRVETHRQLVEQNVARAIELYPTLKEAKSPQRAQFNLKVAELERDPSFGPHFRQTVPGWPMMVARMVAEEQGWSRSAPTVATPAAPTMTTPAQPAQPVLAAPPLVPPRAPAVELVSPNANPGGQTPVVDANSFLRDAANATPDQLLGLLSQAPVASKILERARRAGALRQQGR